MKILITRKIPHQYGFTTIGIIGVIAILVLLFGGGGYWLYNYWLANLEVPPQIAPEMNREAEISWTRLVSSYGYEVSYPKEYQVLSNHFGIEDPARASDISIQDSESPIVIDSSNGITHKKRINIRVEKGRNITSLKQYVEAKHNISRDAGYTTSQVKKSIIAGREAYEFTVNHGYRDENGGFLIYPENKTVWIMQDDSLYWIMYPIDEPVFEEIISTLKFRK